MTQQVAKLRSRKGRRLTTGLRWRSFPDDQRDQTRDEASRQRLHTPEWIVEPVPLLPLAEHHFPGDHDDHQQRQAEQIETERLLLQLDALLLKIVGVPEQGITRGKRQQTDRNVEVKHPSPRITVGNPPAQRRTDNRRQEGSQAEQRHRNTLFFYRKRIQQHALTGRLKTAPRQALHDAKRNQLTETGGHSTKSGREGEDGDREQEVVAAAEMRRQPAGDRQDDGVGGEVARDDPLAVVDRGRQAARDVSQRDHRDGGVEHLHEGRYHDDGGDHPGVDARLRSWR